MTIQNPHLRFTNATQKFVNDASSVGFRALLESKGNPVVVQYAVAFLAVSATAKIPALFVGAAGDSMRMAVKGISNKIGQISPGHPLGRTPSNETKEQKFARYVAPDPVTFKDLLFAKTIDTMSRKISSLTGQGAVYPDRSERLYNRICEKELFNLTPTEYYIFTDLRANLPTAHIGAPMNGAAPPA